LVCAVEVFLPPWTAAVAGESVAALKVTGSLVQFARACTPSHCSSAIALPSAAAESIGATGADQLSAASEVGPGAAAGIGCGAGLEAEVGDEDVTPAGAMLPPLLAEDAEPLDFACPADGSVLAISANAATI
jgi:hypothetical protein